MNGYDDGQLFVEFGGVMTQISHYLADRPSLTVGFRRGKSGCLVAIFRRPLVAEDGRPFVGAEISIFRLDGVGRFLVENTPCDFPHVPRIAYDMAQRKMAEIPAILASEVVSFSSNLFWELMAMLRKLKKPPVSLTKLEQVNDSHDWVFLEKAWMLEVFCNPEALRAKPGLLAAIAEEMSREF